MGDVDGDGVDDLILSSHDVWVRSGVAGSPRGFCDLRALRAGVLAPGDSEHFQCWYRDAGGRTNFSDGVKVYFN